MPIIPDNPIKVQATEPESILFHPTVPHTIPPIERIGWKLGRNSSILESVIESRVKLAELKGFLGGVADHVVFNINLAWIESKASLEVDGHLISSEDLFRGIIATPAERLSQSFIEIERSHHALKMGLKQMLRPTLIRKRTSNRIDLNLIQHLNKFVHPERGGALRGHTEFVEVSDRNYNPIYTPPVGLSAIEHEALLQNLLAETCTYLTKGTGDPLIRMALGHYQFEATRPFAAGNGRTGRLLNSLYLVQQELLPYPTLLMSTAILESGDEYFRRLAEVSSKGWHERWVEYMLAVVWRAAELTLSLIKDIRLAMMEATELVKTKLPRNYNPDFLQHLFSQPYTRPHAVRQAMKWTYPTVAKHLERYGALGLVKQRGEIYVNQPLIAVFHKYGLD
jgi:Fic family protein